MITEDQLEQLAIQWFQDTGWNYVHGAVIAPEGRTLIPAFSHGEKEEYGGAGGIENPHPGPLPGGEGGRRALGGGDAALETSSYKS